MQLSKKPSSVYYIKCRKGIIFLFILDEQGVIYLTFGSWNNASNATSYDVEGAIQLEFSAQQNGFVISIKPACYGHVVFYIDTHSSVSKSAVRKLMLLLSYLDPVHWVECIFFVSGTNLAHFPIITSRCRVFLYKDYYRRSRTTAGKAQGSIARGDWTERDVGSSIKLASCSV